MGWQFWIDRGGTFTDVVALSPDGALRTHKLLSVAPDHYTDAAVAGIRQVLDIPQNEPIPVGIVDAVRMGTTVATNALLERKGDPTLLVVNRGFRDILLIGDQARPKLFELDIRKPPPLYATVVEVGCRHGADGAVVSELDENEALSLLCDARAEGLTSCAIALIHAWRYPEHERRLATLARSVGFTQVSVSHETSRLVRLVPRAETAVVDAYLSPVLRRYVESFVSELPGVPVQFMRSHGGLADAQSFRGRDALLSGPAGGLVGAARTAARDGFERIIGFDMGGTSTDVCVHAGRFAHTSDFEIAGIRVRTPCLPINTVAAGGGSILSFRDGRFQVGPESAGAQPGPTCYRNGGPLTVTDANVLLGKLRAEHFPPIFGPNGNQSIDVAAVERAFVLLAAEIEAGTGQRLRPEAIAEGFVAVAVAHMAAAIKAITLHKGLDPRRFVLACFGGAGGQHACAVADQLGISDILLHPLAGVLSAYGMGLADASVVVERTVEMPFTPDHMSQLDELANEIGRAAAADLASQGTAPSDIRLDRQIDLRYEGSDATISVEFGSYAKVGADFEAAHRRQFGFADDRAVVAASFRIIASVAGAPPDHREIEDAPTVTAPDDPVAIWFGREAQATPVLLRRDLHAGAQIEGPALVRERNATTIVDPGWSATVTESGQLHLRRTTPRAPDVPQEVEREPDDADPIQLELFNNAFMSIAEQMGVVLQNTSQSVNIKERLDFSCALFDAAGDLIANAPHVPVHLGAMSESVRLVLRTRGDSLRPGDVVALNDPYAGGTHLPDLTVITPFFDDGGTLLFFLGSRGHHADVGGLTPGSMPPDASRLEEEGVVIDNLLLVSGGVFQEAAFRDVLLATAYPARNVAMNVADVKAQIAANQKGVGELAALLALHGREAVVRYMGFVMNNAEASVRKAIEAIGDGCTRYRMDDGSTLAVRIGVDHVSRSVTVDFTGTSPQRDNNFNAPPAVTRAVVLYVFRCLVGSDIPLNDGCLRPVTIVIPPGTFLSPERGRAVVAGNTEVSQAVCNALFLALGRLACGQGTMNNFLFGNARHQYYETICGGAGAGPEFDGASAVHTHMTNTRMTDPEILETRYPVRLETFARRMRSGGHGRHRGGDGAVRRVRFLEAMTAVLVSSRRSEPPAGLAGGGDGAAGRQWIERGNGFTEDLPGRFRVHVACGDCVVIETPGGGGFGEDDPAPARPTSDGQIGPYAEERPFGPKPEP